MRIVKQISALLTIVYGELKSYYDVNLRKYYKTVTVKLQCFKEIIFSFSLLEVFYLLVYNNNIKYKKNFNCIKIRFRRNLLEHITDKIALDSNRENAQKYNCFSHWRRLILSHVH